MKNIKIFEFFDKTKNYNMNVFTYIPNENFDKTKIIFVISGCFRDALNYLKNWVGVAKKNRYIIIAPEFDKGNYSIADHEYGNMINIDYDYSSQDIYTPYMKYHEKINDSSNWIYHMIDKIYLKFIKDNNINNDGYIIFGHSSGAQFVHRFLMFGDSKYCKKYIFANAGLYTFFNEEKNYPYGIKNLKDYNNIFNKSLEKDAYILIGTDDIKKDYLNMMASDVEEGKTRFERGINFYNSAKKYAEKYDIKFNWTIEIMNSVNHNNKKVIPYAEKIINK